MKTSTARAWAAFAIFAAAALLLRPVAGAVCASCLIAIGTWPLRDRLRDATRARLPGSSAALLTAGAVAVLVAPLVFGVLEGLREAPVLVHLWASSRDKGLDAPPWLERLPLVGAWAAHLWNAQLAEPGALRDLVHGVSTRVDLHAGRSIALALGHRAMALFFCVLVLYVLYRDGDRLAAQGRTVVTRWFGAPGLRTLDLAVRAVRGTVNGLVLVAVLLAVVMGAAYAVAGVPHPVFWGLVTGVLGIVPFGAGLVLVGVALYLLAVEATITAIVLLAAGGLLVFIVDHVVRPYFVSGPAQVPLVLALLGIVGGLEGFGLLGIFIGPTLVAIALAVWRELVHEADPAAPDDSASPEGPP
jgi:predicted PurR-regulated permease PerM